MFLIRYFAEYLINIQHTENQEVIHWSIINFTMEEYDCYNSVYRF